MALIKLIGFAGENPKIAPRALGDTFAQIAFNTRLDDGALTPIRKKRFAFQFPSAPPEGYDTIYLHGDDWFGWVGAVFAAPGPVASDRLYVMGDGAPKMIVGGVEYPLALAGPSGALTAALSGSPSSDLGSTRLYAYTWVTDFGEESEPSPVSADIYWKPGQTVTLSGFASKPSGRNITKQRIYRSQTSQTGTLLYLIAERNASTGDYVDTVPVDGYQEALPSSGWSVPPDELTGLIAGPNGMMAAYKGKDLYFCEPYRPHAWPETYVMTMDWDIMGLGWFGGSLVVTTKGKPYMVNGSAPELMVSEKLELNLPCLNNRCVIDMGYSIAYPSHDGLVLASSNGARLATEPVFGRDEWLKLNPYIMTAGQYDGRYLATYRYNEGGVDYSGTLILDMTGSQPFVIRSAEYPRAMFYDEASGVLYMLLENSVYEWDAIGAANELQTWRSKLFVLPKPGNFGAILVEVDESITADQVAAIEAEAAAILAQNEVFFALDSIAGEVNGAAVNAFAVNGDLLMKLPSAELNVTVNVFADRKLVATLGKYNEMARLPSGFLAAQWEVEVVSDAQITQVTMAGTATELMGA